MVGLLGHIPKATAQWQLQKRAESEFQALLPRCRLPSRQPRLGFVGMLPHLELLRVSHLPMLAPLEAVLDLDVQVAVVPGIWSTGKSAFNGLPLADDQSVLQVEHRLLPVRVLAPAQQNRQIGGCGVGGIFEAAKGSGCRCRGPSHQHQRKAVTLLSLRGSKCGPSVASSALSYQETNTGGAPMQQSKLWRPLCPLAQQVLLDSSKTCP